VRAIDPIGIYNLAMDESRWPRGLLQEIIETYARMHKFRRTLALVSEINGICANSAEVAWRGVGISEALLITPEASRSNGQGTAHNRTGIDDDDTW
jgi:hypothetical protein